jgi:hypothetical protein
MMTFTKAANLMQKARNGRRKLGNNTYLHALDADTFAVRLHNTDVVKIHADGTYTLTTKGWQTVTTKDRINNYSPVRIHQKAFVWYVGDKEFVDGMKVNENGEICS